jgi:putative transposase
MTAPSIIDPAQFLHEHLASASPDPLGSLLTTFINTLMSAEADAVCGAPCGQSSPERTNVRNGYRHRDFDTRAGTLDGAMPKLREGSYFPDWLLERRRRAERALTTVVATCYLLCVSTRRMEKPVETLGIIGLSKSRVSVMAAELDTVVEQFRTRPLNAGPYTFEGDSYRPPPTSHDQLHRRSDSPRAVATAAIQSIRCGRGNVRSYSDADSTGIGPAILLKPGQLAPSR